MQPLVVDWKGAGTATRREISPADLSKLARASEIKLINSNNTDFDGTYIKAGANFAPYTSALSNIGNALIFVSTRSFYSAPDDNQFANGWCLQVYGEDGKAFIEPYYIDL